MNNNNQINNDYDHVVHEDNVDTFLTQVNDDGSDVTANVVGQEPVLNRVEEDTAYEREISHTRVNLSMSFIDPIKSRLLAHYISTGYIVMFKGLIYLFCETLCSWATIGNKTVLRELCDVLDLMAPVNYFKAVSPLVPVLQTLSTTINVPTGTVCTLRGRVSLAVSINGDDLVIEEVHPVVALVLESAARVRFSKSANPQEVANIYMSFNHLPFHLIFTPGLRVPANTPFMDYWLDIFEPADRPGILWNVGLAMDDMRHLGRLVIVHSEMGSVGKSSFINTL